MSNEKWNRNKLIDEINALGRRMSTSTILFHQAAATKAGLSGTDHKYLDLLFQEGPMTAGQLAEMTGLTTGAVTGLIDRLEKEGLVKRESAPNDRRKVMVVLQMDVAMKRIAPVFMELKEDMEKFYKKYSLDQLQVIHDYLTDSISFFNQKVKDLKRSEKPFR